LRITPSDRLISLSSTVCQPRR